MPTSRRVPLTAIEHYAALYDEVLRPFVYRRYLDFSVFESLRDMKAMIAREVERRELQDNVKLGPGGIREIEFIVQAFQLMRGGSDRRLQSRELRTVLPLLVGQRLLRREAVAELDAAYRYLRVVENRLQQWNDEQTHQLPEDEIGARAAGLGDGRERLECVAARSSRCIVSASRSISRRRCSVRGVRGALRVDLGGSEEARGCWWTWIAPPAGSSCATLPTTAGSTRPGGADCTSCSARLLPLIAQSKSPDDDAGARPENPRDDRRPHRLSRAAERERGGAAQAGRAVRAEPVSRRPDRRASVAAR